MQVPFLGEWALGSAKLGYRKSTGVADPIAWWGCAVTGSPGMLPGQFSILTSLRVTIWRASLQREGSMQTGRKGLFFLLVAVETGSIPL